VVGDVRRCRETVLEAGRELRLWREPVRNADHDRGDVACQQPGLVVVGVDVTDHEAAAMEEHHGRDRAVRVRAVHPDREFAGGAGHRPVLDRAHHGETGDVAHVDRHRTHPRPRLFGCAVGEGRRTELLHQGQGGSDLRINRHGNPFWSAASRGTR
jgi:hypothetical protein